LANFAIAFPKTGLQSDLIGAFASQQPRFSSASGKGFPNAIALSFSSSALDSVLQVSFARPGVDPRRVQAFVSQQGGHLVQRSAAVHQVLGEGMPERVAGAVLESGLVGIFVDQVIDPGLTQGASLSQEESFGSVFWSLRKVVRSCKK
jgi:hypothetical protein